VVSITYQHLVRYEPNELPDCSTPQIHPSAPVLQGQTFVTIFLQRPFAGFMRG
jgi:hypothetical protein